MQRKQSFFFSITLFCLSGTIPAGATTYTVKAGGGGSYTTILACANAAAAGDTCTIYAGTYAGWTQSANGSSGSPITFTANPGDTVTVTSGITLSGRGYITISYLALQATIQGNQATNHCIIDHNTDNTTLFDIHYNLGTYTSTDNVISNNTVTMTPSQGIAMEIYGDRNRIENNDLSGQGDDCLDVGGSNVVVRGNYCHKVDGTQSGGSNHIDAWQGIGGAAPILTQSLIEHNIEQGCTNDAGNCHHVIIRTSGDNTLSGSVGISDGVIIRYEYAQSLDGMCFDLGGLGDQVQHTHVYNNTCATEAKGAGSGLGVTFYNNVGTPVAGVALNNIFYNTVLGSPSWSPIAGNSAGDVLLENANLCFTSGYSGGWNSPYSTEATYAALHNVDPKFANYPTDGTVQSGSPAIGAGVPLTTVAAGDSGSGTSLIVTDARFFQPGWAGAQADWIRVGSTNTVQIASVNYTTNTITLANSVSRSAGTPVYLYKDSSGNVVLFGNAPDLGAYPYASAGSGGGAPPAAPTNLTGVPH